MQKEALKEFANEHLFYEVQMFVETAKGLRSGKISVVMKNAMIESFGMHSRVLYEFLFRKSGKSDDVLAVDFFDDKTSWQNIVSRYDTLKSKLERISYRAGKEIAHLTEKRYVNPADKDWTLDLSVVDEVIALLQIFVENVPTDRRPDKIAAYLELIKRNQSSSLESKVRLFINAQIAMLTTLKNDFVAQKRSSLLLFLSGSLLVIVAQLLSLGGMLVVQNENSAIYFYVLTFGGISLFLVSLFDLLFFIGGIDFSQFYEELIQGQKPVSLVNVSKILRLAVLYWILGGVYLLFTLFLFGFIPSIFLSSLNYIEITAFCMIFVLLLRMTMIYKNKQLHDAIYGALTLALIIGFVEYVSKKQLVPTAYDNLPVTTLLIAALSVALIEIALVCFGKYVQLRKTEAPQ